jgi:hypothetical protein
VAATLGLDYDTGQAHWLIITIAAMESVACNVEEMSCWAAALPYPWCDARAVEVGTPYSSALSDILGRLRPGTDGFSARQTPQARARRPDGYRGQSRHGGSSADQGPDAK